MIAADVLRAVAQTAVAALLLCPAAETFGRDEMLWAAAALSGGTWLLVLALPSARAMRRADTG